MVDHTAERRATTTTRLNVAVLHGGPSSEHDISVITSRGVLRSLREGGHRAWSVWVDRAGRWHFAGDAADAGTAVADPVGLPGALAALLDLTIDVAFLGFHGTFGEDGRVQGALELAGIPYTGSRVTATALAMDKPLARRVMASAGIRVPEAVELKTDTLVDEAGCAAAAALLIERLALPVVVKVPEGGSSLGIEIPRDRDGLLATLARLGPQADSLLCERFVAGTELTAPVVARLDGTLETLPTVEIAPIGEGFFDYEAKYDAALTDEIVPARITADVERRCREIGLAAHLIIGCRGISRTDLILDADGVLWVLEINTLPGLTPESLLPKSAGAVNCSYLQLLERIIAASR